MADDHQDDANSSQSGDRELQETPASDAELSDEHDAVATGFSVDESGSTQFDGDSAEYEAVGDEPHVDEPPADGEEDQAHDDVLDPEMYDGEAPAEEVTAEEAELDEQPVDHPADASDSRPPPLQPQLEAVLDAPEPDSLDAEPLPEIGPYLDPPTLTLWVGGEQHETFAVAQDKLVIGRADQSDTDSGRDVPSVDVDLGSYTDEDGIWSRHAALYRHNKNYTLYATADATTQVNDERLELGEHRRLEDGDVVIFGRDVGLEFSLPDSRQVAAETAATSEAQFQEEPAPPVDEDIDTAPDFEDEANVDHQFDTDADLESNPGTEPDVESDPPGTD